MKTVTVVLEGLSPLLMSKDDGSRKGEKAEAFTEEEAWVFARNHAYLDAKGAPVLPGPNLQRALIQGAAYSKGKGRSSLKKSAAAGIQVAEFELPIMSPAPELDRRTAVIPATRGRVLVYRLRVPLPWTVQATVHWDDELIAETELATILKNTGTRVGVLSFRPEKLGPFGQFKVTSITEVKAEHSLA